jgi:hypothetical protein
MRGSLAAYLFGLPLGRRRACPHSRRAFSAARARSRHPYLTRKRSRGRQSMSGTISSMSYVTDGREAIGFVCSRGKLGFEAFDTEERSLGMFKTAAAAANVVFNAAASERP